MPSFCVANNQHAMNHTVSGVRVRSKIVPAVGDVRTPQPRHISRLSPSRHGSATNRKQSTQTRQASAATPDSPRNRRRSRTTTRTRQATAGNALRPSDETPPQPTPLRWIARRRLSLARSASRRPRQPPCPKMSDWINTAIAAGAALLASGLTGAITLRAAGRSELSAALQAYGYATDRLGVEISQMPPLPGRIGGAMRRAVARARPSTGGGADLASHPGTPSHARARHLHGASNRLMLVAPARVLEPVIRINELLARMEERDEAWHAEWADARQALAEQSR